MDKPITFESAESLTKILWDQLRLDCCCTKLNARLIVIVHEHDIRKAVKAILSKP